MEIDFSSNSSSDTNNDEGEERIASILGPFKSVREQHIDNFIDQTGCNRHTTAREYINNWRNFDSAV